MSDLIEKISELIDESFASASSDFILSSFTGLVISLFYLFSKDLFINFMTDIESIKSISFQFSFWLILLP